MIYALSNCCSASNSRTDSLGGFSSADFRDAEILSFPRHMPRTYEIILTNSLGLPDPNVVIAKVFDTAWPQVLALCSAFIGVALVLYVIRSFTAR